MACMVGALASVSLLLMILQADFVHREPRSRSSFDLLSALQRLERQIIRLEHMSEKILLESLSSSSGLGLSGPWLDPNLLAHLEQKSEEVYWHRRSKLDALPSPDFKGLEPSWPCLWGKEHIGVSDGGNKWACGTRLLRIPCVVYSFSLGHTEFGKGASKLTKSCELHMHGPLSGETRRPKDMHVHFHNLSLGSYDGRFKLGAGTSKNLTRLEGMPVKTLSTIMREHGHSHIDALNLDIEGLEYEVISSLNATGWPSIGQMMIDVHADKEERYRERLSMLVDQVESAGFRLFHKEINICAPHACVEYAFIQRGWRPEIMDYSNA